ncbi:MAG: hypothetical protein IPO89_01515 [Actinomycetales bacterium]|nr:hypothetical protein [Candidatus Lutibacillus vidarii]
MAIWRAEKSAAQPTTAATASAAQPFSLRSRPVPDRRGGHRRRRQPAYSFGRYSESRGQPVLVSGYLGSIGFGYPAALGAWAAYPGSSVVRVTGDGGSASSSPSRRRR